MSTMRPLDPTTVPLTGTHLIEASAGTGKTYTITTLVLRLLLECGLEVEDLLIVTFTRAATAELRDRIWGRLREARAAFDRAIRNPDATPPKDPAIRALLERVDPKTGRTLLTRAMQGFDRATISTIHGFCQRMLQENAFESGAPFEAELVGDDGPLRREIARDHWARAVHAAPPALIRQLDVRSIDPDAMVDLVSAAVRNADARIVPDRASLPAVDPAAREAGVAAHVKAHKEAAELWSKEESAVRALLVDNDDLNKRSYKDVGQMLDSLAAVLGAPVGRMHAEDEKAVRKLTATALAKGVKKNCPTPRHELFDALDTLIEKMDASTGRLDLEIEHLRLDAVEHARRELPRRKQARSVWSFDDLLVQLRDALVAGPQCALARRIRGRYKVALIDEFQDTDPVQYGVFRTIWAGQDGHALFLIGDPKQAIYAFRGADIHAYLAAGGDAADHAWTMTTNWRSDPGLLRGIEALFRRGDQPFILPGIDFQHVGARPEAEDVLRDGSGARMAPLELAFLERDGRTGTGSYTNRITKEHARWHERAAARIVDLLQGGVTIKDKPLRPGQIAVLVKNRYQAADVQAALRALHVPSVRQTDDSVLDMDSAGWLHALLDAIRNPRDATRVRTALATPLWGRDAAELVALRDDDDGWVAEIERLATWRQIWEDRGFTPAFRRMLRDLRIPERALGWPEGERVMTDLLHLAELLQDAASSGGRGPDALVRWFSDVRADERLREADAGQLRLESDAEAVQILTIHKSKGLEFPVVLCPYLGAESKLRDKDRALLCHHDSNGDVVLDIRDPKGEDKKPALAAGERETFAESMRLLYVAVTRAAHRCEIFWGATMGFNRSPLGYALYPEGGDDPVGATRTSLGKASDSVLLEGLHALAAAAPTDVSVRVLDDAVPGVFHDRPDAVPTLTARRARSLPSGWSTSSFSRLASAGSGDERVSDDHARDHDERSEVPVEPVTQDGPPVPLDAFPKGARAGNLMHDILEHADFAWRAGAEDGELDALVAKMLRRYGQDVEQWTAPLSAALDGVLGTPLGREAGEPRLRDITADARISEMEFILPVAHGSSAQALTPARLAAALRAHGGPGLPDGYADSVERLRFRELQGWMRGFVDLVYCWQDRWYVVDYKSNHLGPQASGYRDGALDSAMAHHHYVLQYHLYCVALHRALAHRLSGYDPARHFGGVRYLFLRGMSPDHALGTGVFEDAPPPALLEALSMALEGKAP